MYSFKIRKKIGVLGILTGVVFLVGIAFSIREVPDNQRFSHYPNTQYFKSVEILTNEQVRRRIMDETPGLVEALTQRNAIKIVRLLRSWAADNMDLNSRGTSYWEKLNRGDQTLANMLYLFDHDLLGVHCADGSRFLGMIYNLFGYNETFLYNSGVYFRDTNFLHLNEGTTHVITLVKVLHQGQDLWVAEDVLFDSEYRVPGEEVSDFSDILKRIKANPNARVERVHDQRVFDREWLTLSEQEANGVDDFEDFAEKVQVASGPDYYKFGWDSRIKQESSSAQILRELLDFEGPIYPFHLFLFPIDGGWEFLGVSGIYPLEEQYKTRISVSTS